MGNAHAKPHPRPRNKKQVHWKAADRPSPPGKPRLSDNELTPDLVTIIWTKPIRDGGSPINGYLVEHRRTGSPHWVRASPMLAPIPELTLSGLEPGWRYQFRVRAENAVGLSDPSEESEPLTVTLQKFAITSPKFTEDLKDATVLENEKVEFRVHFLGQPAPKICWFKDGFEIFSSRRTRILTESDRSVLTIHQSALADEGEIKCTATNKAGHTSTKAKLTLEAPPSIRLPRQYEDGLLFEIGEVLRLKVSVAGRPTPLVFWSHNGETIQNDDRYEIEYVDKSSILKLGEAKRSDRGEYQIKAVNKIGQDIASFLVTITDKPSPPSKARVVMTLGKSVTLSWGTPVDDGGCKIGNYIIEYYRLGWNVWLKAATSRQLTTILGDLIEGSEYKFRVKAESPYGVSDPSEESDVVFIPDPKRGITSPQARSLSQPKDLIDEIAIPKAAKRKGKDQPRSQSSTAKIDAFNNMYDEVPKRPERTKIKSPPKTPELSPRNTRKELTKTQTLIDRASIARELAYGSPEIKVKLDTLQPSPEKAASERRRSVSPSPQNRTPSPKDKSPPSPKDKSPPSPKQQKATPSPEEKKKQLSPKDKRALFREKSEEESSEFMLVLYPDANEKGQRRDLEFDFDEYDIPPPLSLSAPELGAEPPIFGNLKTCASSTELLHERAMMRFNEAAAAAEKEEMSRKRKFSSDGQRSIEIPKIQINSKDEQDIVGLERKASRRRSSGGIVQQQLLWIQKRFSFSKLNELEEIAEVKRQKSPKPELVKQRSESEEKEEAQFEKVRAKMAFQNQSSLEKRSIEVVDEDKWLEDYEESLSESETESSEDDRKFDVEPPQPIYSEEDEDIYHPGAIAGERKIISSEPFEILTKRNKLPDPNFIPKPILKRTDDKFDPPKEVLREVVAVKPRSRSPMPPEIGRERSLSLAQANMISPKVVPKQFQRSISLSAKEETVLTAPKPNLSAGMGHSISAVATLCGMTAASIVIPEKLLEKKQDEEESKVVVDHYMDIVKNYGHRKQSVPQLPLYRATTEQQVAPVSTIPSSQTSLKQELDLITKRRLSIKEEMKTPTPSPTKQEEKRSSIIEEKQLSQLIRPLSKEAKEIIPQRRFSVKEEKEAVQPRRPSVKEEKEAVQPRSPSVKEEKEVVQQQPRKPPIKEEPKKQEIVITRKEKSPSPNSTRGGSINRSSRRSSTTSSTSSRSPTHLENWSGRSRRKVSPSPLKNRSTSSPSPIPYAKPRPKLREIMTQTSIGLELNYSSDSRTSSPSNRTHELMAKAEVQVRSFVDYITDLAMFFVACWLYLFSNELLAIPVLLIMVYRQLTNEVKKRIPKWIMRRMKKIKTKKQ